MYSVLNKDERDGVSANVPWYLDERFLLLVATTSIIFPLSSLRNIAMLDKASLFSVGLVFVYIVVVIYNLFVIPQKMFYKEGFVSNARPGFINTINVFAFALSCHHNVLPIFRSMTELNIKKFSHATHGALFTTTILYIAISIAGYISFTGNASGNLLIDYCISNFSILFARIAFTATVLLTSPLQIYSSREAISTIIHKKYKFNWFVHVFLTALLIIICYLCAVFIADIELVMSLSGSLIAAPVVYILPGLSMLLIMDQGYKIDSFTKLACYCVIVFGCLILIVGTSMSIVNFTQTRSPKIKYWCEDSLTPFNLTLRRELESQLNEQVASLWNYP